MFFCEAIARSLGSAKFRAPATDFRPSKFWEQTFAWFQRQNFPSAEAFIVAAGNLAFDAPA
jgi:hypothetical protein